MSSLYADAAPRRAGFVPFAAEAAFAALLLIAFVGFTPFALRTPQVLALGENGVSGAGDTARQICYLIVFAVTVGTAIERRGLRAFANVPVAFAILLIWCVASAAWSLQSAVTLRRAGLEIVVVLSALLSVETLGVEKALRILRGVLIAVLLVNWISIPLTSRAIHQPGELDPSVVGDWRGLYFHKNIAGGMCAISALVFLYFAVARKSRIDWALAAGALGFLVMTHSKSSMGLLPLGVLAGAVYGFAWQRELDRSIVVVAFGLLLVLAAAAFYLDADAIARVLEDPTQFTGRTAIWHAELSFIRDHPLLGSGFGSFSDTGAASPLHNYVGGGWVEAAAHGHNAYLQLLVTIGGIGFALAMLNFIVFPMVSFWQADRAQLQLYAFLFAIFVFVIFHNVLESDFLEGDGPVWVVFVLMLALLRTHPQKPAVSWPIP
ncbi:MAG TPA: O-antigen ligase [Rhizomicrobium sp.]|jgi:exopolysaccharide production protein ExoQ|nr:O-antigen ligase [Rhizomicrobium sp.]